MQSFKHIPLAKYTSLNIGGSAKELIIVQTQKELVDIVKKSHQNHQPYLVIGGGSNLLVSDDGVDFLIIKNEVIGITQETQAVITSKASQSLLIQNKDHYVGMYRNGTIPPRDDEKDPGQARMTIIVKSGTSLQNLVDYSIQNGLSGLQKLTGIPGTVGGAVFGNAGAYGQSISDHLTKVVCFDGSEVITLTKDECDFKYRWSYFKKSVYTILEVHFELAPGDPQKLTREAAQTLQQRLKKYPAGIKCPGSFFKNIVADTLLPEILAKIPLEKIVYGKIPAGSLLEEVGAKGAKLGNIEIADYHANLFINKGHGTAEDFYNLAKTYANKVKQKFGVQLEPEVQLINLPAISVIARP